MLSKAHFAKSGVVPAYGYTIVLRRDVALVTKTKRLPLLPETISCPKLPPQSSGYRYYAGYSRSFVYDILSRWPKQALVMDPWNGSGTTTTVAAEAGLQCLGIDLNPAMVVIARSALLSKQDASVIRRQANGLRCLRLTTESIASDDPLLEWLDRSSVARIRGVQNFLVGSTRFTHTAISDITPVEAYWLTVIFDTVRRATKAWRSSNPTWMKSRRQTPPAKLLWRPTVRAMYDQVVTMTPTPTPATSRVILGSSTDLATYRINPDLTLGSPPYCTRIDYAVATRVELSVLGYDRAEQSSLRRQLMGTTTVPRVLESPTCAIGETATKILDAIADHPSKASRTYYLKWLSQYMSAYGMSIAQVASITARDGTIGLVVQDSFYKELHIDLPRITIEIMRENGWLLHRAYTFGPRRTLAHINPRAIAYRKNANPEEHALFFRLE